MGCMLQEIARFGLASFDLGKANRLANAFRDLAPADRGVGKINATIFLF